MNVSLTPELEQFVQAKVENGRYNSASEVVREALRLLEEHEKARATQLAEFNLERGRRLASLDRGVDLAEVRSRLRRKSQKGRQRESECRQEGAEKQVPRLGLKSSLGMTNVEVVEM